MNALKQYSSSVKVFFPKFNREEVVDEVARCVKMLRGRLALERVVLFGSYAKEKYTVASDIDLLVIFDDEKSGEDEVYKVLMKSIKLPRVELHILPKSSLKLYKESKWMKIIEEEGVKIL